MTDAAGASAAGNPDDTQNGAGDEGQNTGATGNPFAELDEATREWVEKRHDNDPMKVAQQAFELDKFAGNAVAVPKADASQEDFDKFYSRLGRPESADKYDLTVPEDLPENLPYDADAAKWFRETAFSHGLTQDQAQKLHDGFIAQQAELAKTLGDQTVATTEATVTEANEALQKQWGAPTGETYKANLELSRRFFDAIDDNGGLTDVLSKRGLLGPNGEVLVPELAFAFAKAGGAIFTEGKTLGDGAGVQGANPFEGDINLTKVMELVKADPDKARVMAKAAGLSPSDYGL